MNVPWYRWSVDEPVLNQKFQPCSSWNEYTVPLGNQFKIKVTAPSFDGTANDHLIKILAKDFGGVRTAVKLISRESSRVKTVSIASPSKVPLEKFMHTKENHL